MSLQLFVNLHQSVWERSDCDCMETRCLPQGGLCALWSKVNAHRLKVEHRQCNRWFFSSLPITTLVWTITEHTRIFVSILIFDTCKTRTNERKQKWTLQQFYLYVFRDVRDADCVCYNPSLLIGQWLISYNFISQDQWGLWLSVYQLHAPAGPAFLGFNASTADRHMWATSVAAAHLDFMATVASAWRTPRKVRELLHLIF